jgi:hypothetical protein
VFTSDLPAELCMHSYSVLDPAFELNFVSRRIKPKRHMQAYERDMEVCYNNKHNIFVLTDEDVSN